MARDNNEFFSPNDWTGFLVRLTIAIVLFPHGAQKLLGWWGGAGYDSTMQFFTDTVGLPYLIGVLVILIEFFCPFFLLLGIATRYAAGFVMIVMVGIIITVQHHYFFMNWFGTQDGEGMEFFLLMIALCCVLILNGGGKVSLEMLVASIGEDLRPVPDFKHELQRTMNHNPVSFAKIYIARNEVRDPPVSITVGIQELLTKVLEDNPQLSHIVIQEVNSNDLEFGAMEIVPIDDILETKSLNPSCGCSAAAEPV